jgi:hypothetical protein
MTPAKLRLAATSMGRPDTNINDLCTETRRHPPNALPTRLPERRAAPDGRKLLADSARKPR